jgi:hypothetical protein
MFRSFRLIALVTLSVLSMGVVHAETDAVGVFRVPYEHIADLKSQPGESEHAFLKRIGPQLRAYADQTGYEACGVIGSDGQGNYGVVLGSSHAHLSCINKAVRVLPGMTSTGETIHTHGKQGGFTMSKIDKIMFVLDQDNLTAAAGLDPNGMTQVTVHGQDRFHFSGEDFGNPGYLATPDGLLYQHGPGTEQAVTN